MQQELDICPFFWFWNQIYSKNNFLAKSGELYSTLMNEKVILQFQPIEWREKIQKFWKDVQVNLHRSDLLLWMLQVWFLLFLLRP